MLNAEAKKLLKAEERYKEAKGALEEAERERDKARERCRPLLLSKAGEANIAGAISITVTPCVSAKSFRLAEYLRRYKVTKTMEPFVGEGKPYDRWTVKRIAA